MSFICFFFLKNLVVSKKSTNFALGFGNEGFLKLNSKLEINKIASLAQLARARDL